MWWITLVVFAVGFVSLFLDFFLLLVSVFAVGDDVDVVGKVQLER